MRSLLISALGLIGVSCGASDGNVCGDAIWGVAEECDPSAPEFLGRQQVCSGECAWERCTFPDADRWAVCDQPGEWPCEAYCYPVVCGDGRADEREVCLGPEAAITLDLGEPLVDWLRQDLDEDGLLDLVVATPSGITSYLLRESEQGWVYTEDAHWPVEGAESIGITYVASNLYDLWISVPEGEGRRISWLPRLPWGWEEGESAVVDLPEPVRFLTSPWAPLVVRSGDTLARLDWFESDGGLNVVPTGWRLNAFMPAGELVDLRLAPTGLRDALSLPWHAAVLWRIEGRLTVWVAEFWLAEGEVRLHPNQALSGLPWNPEPTHAELTLLPYSARDPDARTPAPPSTPFGWEAPTVVAHDGQGRGLFCRPPPPGTSSDVTLQCSPKAVPAASPLLGARLDGPGRHPNGLPAEEALGDFVWLQDGKPVYAYPDPSAPSTPPLSRALPDPGIEVDELVVDDLNGDGLHELWMWNREAGRLVLWVNHP